MENARTKMIAPCGIDCGVCELHIFGSNPEFVEKMVQRGIPREKLPCNGCRNIEGACPVIPAKCKTYTCVQNKKVEFCSECSDFPCNMLHPSSDRADVLPHNLKVFNLCTIRRIGAEEFVKMSMDVKKRYYQGKMSVGAGPQIES